MPRAADTDIDMGGRSPHFKLWGGRVPPGSYARDGGDGPPHFKLWGGRVPPVPPGIYARGESCNSKKIKF